MKNKYFKEMQKKGIKYKKALGLVCVTNETGGLLFSEGETSAFKFWAIADRYNASEIVVDELPSPEQIPVFLNTFRAAGINSFVSTLDQMGNDILMAYGCEVDEKEYVRVFRKETELYFGKLEVIKGLRVTF